MLTVGVMFIEWSLVFVRSLLRDRDVFILWRVYVYLEYGTLSGHVWVGVDFVLFWCVFQNIWDCDYRRMGDIFKRDRVCYSHFPILFAKMKNILNTHELFKCKRQVVSLKRFLMKSPLHPIHAKPTIKICRRPKCGTCFLTECSQSTFQQWKKVLI